MANVSCWFTPKPQVWKGLLKDGDNTAVPEYMVACKVVKVAAGGLDSAAAAVAEEELLNEALLMAQVDAHANLVSVVGVVTRGQGQPKILVLSYCEHGELLGQLKRRCADEKPLDEQTKFRFCGEVAAGMRHLGEHGLVHRDLAARNVLLSSGMVCKVADFGLSRRVQTEDNASDYYRSTSGIVPVRWTAPEGLSAQKFSAASDVWSFGIVCVEIFQDGEKPYLATGSNPAVIRMVTAGKVHPRPVACAPRVYAELVKCWHFEPDLRTSFQALASVFGKLAGAAANDQGGPSATTPGCPGLNAGYDLGGANQNTGYDLGGANQNTGYDLDGANQNTGYDLGGAVTGDGDDVRLSFAEPDLGEHNEPTSAAGFEDYLDVQSEPSVMLNASAAAGEDDYLAVTSRLVDVMNEAPPGGAAGGAGRSDAPDSDLELDLDAWGADGNEYMTVGATAGASDANERHTSAGGGKKKAKAKGTTEKKKKKKKKEEPAEVSFAEFN